MSVEPFLDFARPSITDAERHAVLEVLDSGWLSTGARTREFEAFAESSACHTPSRSTLRRPGSTSPSRRSDRPPVTR